MQPGGLLRQGEVHHKGAGFAVAGGIPGKQVIGGFKRFDLFVKQAVIRRQAGQEHQHRPPRLEIIHPVVDHAVWHCVSFFCHFWYPSRCGFLVLL